VDGRENVFLVVGRVVKYVEATEIIVRSIAFEFELELELELDFELELELELELEFPSSSIATL